MKEAKIQLGPYQSLGEATSAEVENVVRVASSINTQERLALGFSQARNGTHPLYAS